MYEITVLEDTKNGEVRHITAKPCDNVCCKQIEVEVNNGIVTKVLFTGGCHGNTQGVSALIAGMEVNEAIRRISGIDCRGRGTSCPDQLAKVLELTK